MQGKTISGYTLKEKIGVGGMAEVWLAENAIGKKAAVKLLLPRFCGDESIVTRFENEAKVMVQLKHPNIRQVYDYSNIDGRPCILMEYLAGNDLKTLLKKCHRFSDIELRRWWNQIVDALNYTHAKNIVHRDIKPGNLFVDLEGNISLLDFGIAKIEENSSLTQTGSLMGTLMYMSPEQVKDSKHIGPKTDIYSLAVTFVHLLMGKAPYDDTSSDDYTIRKGIVEKSLDLSPLPADWRALLTPYLAKNPDNRPALRPIESVPPEEDVADSGDKKNETKPQSKTGLWIAFVIAVFAIIFGEEDVQRGAIAVAAVLLFFLLKSKKKEQEPIKEQKQPQEQQKPSEKAPQPTKEEHVDPEATIAQSEPDDPEATVAQPEPIDPERTVVDNIERILS